MAALAAPAYCLISLAAPPTIPPSTDTETYWQAAERGDYEKAIRLLTRAVKSGKLSGDDLDYAYMDLASLYNNCGVVQTKRGNHSMAISNYTRAIEIEPRYTNAYNNRGVAWMCKGGYIRAMIDFANVIAINPRYANAYNNLSMLLSICPDSTYRDGKFAITLANMALKLEGETPVFLSTLAAAYAEAGMFQKAIEAQERAMELLKEQGGDDSILADFERYLLSYKAGNPRRAEQMNFDIDNNKNK